MNNMFPLKSFFSGTEKRKEKKNSRLSGIPGYLLSIGLCVVFALYCSGRVGWFLVLTFICAPILSLLFTLLFRKQITAACMLETPIAAKGEHGILTVSLQSKGFLPSPFVTITFTDSPYLTCGEPLLTLSLLPRSTETVSFHFTASVCGASFVGIKEIRIWDYLGLFSFTAPVPDAQEIHVVPDIAEVSSDEDYILEIYRQSAETGDSEETIDAGSTLFGGFLPRGTNSTCVWTKKPLPPGCASYLTPSCRQGKKICRTCPLIFMRLQNRIWPCRFLPRTPWKPPLVLPAPSFTTASRFPTCTFLPIPVISGKCLSGKRRIFLSWQGNWQLILFPQKGGFCRII